MKIYDPKTDKFPYTEYTDQHYLKIKKNNGMVLDKNYPYVDKSKGFLFKQFLVRCLLVLFVFLLARIRLGLKIEGRKNLRIHKEEIKKGIISCCNHVHMWDFIGILRGIFPKKPYVLVWGNNVRSENATLVRMVGGIPVPEDDLQATVTYYTQVKELLNSGGWLHIYPEGSMWEYYQPIRPFKRGAAYLATRLDKPILPLAYSYRKPGWIRRKIFKQIALYTLHIGEPIYANKSLPKDEQEQDLVIRSHRAVCELAGIDPDKNIYPPVFDHSKRIDYYTDKYGVGYKGSK